MGFFLYFFFFQANQYIVLKTVQKLPLGDFENPSPNTSRRFLRRHLMSVSQTLPFDSEQDPSISAFPSCITETALSLTTASARCCLQHPSATGAFCLSFVNKLILLSWTAGFHCWHHWPDGKWQVEWMVAPLLLLMHQVPFNRNALWSSEQLPPSAVTLASLGQGTQSFLCRNSRLGHSRWGLQKWGGGSLMGETTQEDHSAFLVCPTLCSLPACPGTPTLIFTETEGQRFSLPWTCYTFSRGIYFNTVVHSGPGLITADPSCSWGFLGS